MAERTPIIVWFRDDLRVSDHAALSAAANSGRPVVPVYVLDDQRPFAPGAAARWWLHHSLSALSERLGAIGAPVVLRRGPSDAALAQLAAETGATSIFVQRSTDVDRLAADARLFAKLGLDSQEFAGALLHQPDALKTGAGGHFRVFTPFFRALTASVASDPPLTAPRRIIGFSRPLESDSLLGWKLTPKRPNWAAAFGDAWSPGEAGAQARLAAFLDMRLAYYRDRRDAPAEDATSGLSAHLHFGDISPRQVWHAVLSRFDAQDPVAQKFLSELGWREFSHHLLYHHPDLGVRNMRPEFDRFPWRDDAEVFAAWSRGRTGIPIVDAGMRQLWATGWMHNRVRMIVASFLVKNLLVDWRRGAAWFWDTLVDADAANNNASWQWVAGCGADAAPYFRIFNPVTQGKTHDPKGDYVRRWVPELASLRETVIHEPWVAGASELNAASVRLGVTYPLPIANLAETRARALQAFASLKSNAEPTHPYQEQLSL